MTRLALIFAAALCLTPPALAQAPETAEPEQDGQGLSLMERGARMFMEGILREMEPALDDIEGMAGEIEPAIREFAREMGPALGELLARIDDLSNYHAPEMLPNGDIIIRRKEPLVPDEAPEETEPKTFEAPAPGEDIEI